MIIQNSQCMLLTPSCARDIIGKGVRLRATNFLDHLWVWFSCLFYSMVQFLLGSFLLNIIIEYEYYRGSS